jgi:hypothetical protein
MERASAIHLYTSTVGSSSFSDIIYLLNFNLSCTCDFNLCHAHVTSYPHHHIFNSPSIFLFKYHVRPAGQLSTNIFSMVKYMFHIKVLFSRNYLVEQYSTHPCPIASNVKIKCPFAPQQNRTCQNKCTESYFDLCIPHGS